MAKCPYRLPIGFRIAFLLLAVFLVAYGVYGVAMNDLYMPGRLGDGAHLQQGASWLQLMALLSFSFVLVADEIANIDRRASERNYGAAKMTCIYGGFVLTALAAVVHLVQQLL